jgi:hypothetical protein
VKVAALPGRWVSAAVCLSLLALSSVCDATDLWSAPYEGVREMHRRVDDVDVRVLFVDLTNPSVSLVATRPVDRMITVSEFARRYEADIAMNANFFDVGSCGLMVGEFDVMDRAYEDRCTASIAFGLENEVALFDSTMAPRGPVPAAWMANVLSGKPFLIRDGIPLTHWMRPQHLYRPNPRSVVGLTEDRHTLVMVLADGRRHGVPGLTAFQVIALLREFDVTDAVNLDGGGSTELVMGGAIVNQPSDGRERIVMSHLGVRIRPGAQWDNASLEAYGSPNNVRPGEIATVWLEVRNMGRRSWRAGQSPVLTLDDGAIGYIATVPHEVAPGYVGRFEVRWLARGEGERQLRADLRTPGGEPLPIGPLTFTVNVRAPNARPAPVDERATAVASLAAVQLPQGLGAASIQLGNCSVSPGPVCGGRSYAPLAMAVAITLGARHRRRTLARGRRRTG